MSQRDGAAVEQGTLFNAILMPHRSLTRRGFLLVICGFAGVAFVASLWFVINGAWPVMPFFGCEVALLYWAFRTNYRDARAREIVRLTPAALSVEQLRPSGRRNRVLFQPPHWLRVEVQSQRGGSNSLTLRSHGRSLTIGRFLTPAERVAFARALRAALGRLKRATALPPGEGG